MGDGGLEVASECPPRAARDSPERCAGHPASYESVATRDARLDLPDLSRYPIERKVDFVRGKLNDGQLRIPDPL